MQYKDRNHLAQNLHCSLIQKCNMNESASLHQTLLEQVEESGQAESSQANNKQRQSG